MRSCRDMWKLHESTGQLLNRKRSLKHELNPTSVLFALPYYPFNRLKSPGKLLELVLLLVWVCITRFIRIAKIFFAILCQLAVDNVPRPAHYLDFAFKYMFLSLVLQMTKHDVDRAVRVIRS